MEDVNKYYKNLLQKYLDGTCTKEELIELARWAKEKPSLLENELMTFWDSVETGQHRDELFDAVMLQASEIEKIVKETEKGKIVPVSRNSFRSRKWLSAAAAVLLILTGTALWFIINNKPVHQELAVGSGTEPEQSEDVMPGGDHAMLTLADGSTILLDSAGIGTISQQGNVTVIKLDDGQLAYDHSAASTEVVFNTITTPRGGQYQLILADGSKVWLNAESSLTFPTSFPGKERRVTLTGEGYFEIAHNAEKPFYVSAQEMQVHVLGTHFNINAYNDEGSTKTTLLEGSVRISAGGQLAVLKPGQQSDLKGGKIKVNQGVNINAVTAWVRGDFYFDNNSLQEVMRQIARWYDVNVQYNGEASGRTFSGAIKRSLSLAQVMRILQYNDVKYSIVGKQIIISQ